MQIDPIVVYGVGDKILINGQIAQHGIAIMSVREGLDFESEICQRLRVAEMGLVCHLPIC